MKFQFTANRFILDWIKPNKEFLDLACGKGELLDYAKSIGCEVNGLDIKSDYRDARYHDLNKSLPFKKESFDIVTCIDSLEHITNVSQVFTEVHRILRPNGTFIVTIPNSRWYRAKHTSFFTYRYLKELINYANFSIAGERHFIGIPRVNRYFMFR